MLVHGAKDERVPIKHMHELVDRMAAVGKKPEQIVVEKKEAHGFRDIDNNVNLYTKMLAFFDRHIGAKQAPAQPTRTTHTPRNTKQSPLAANPHQPSSSDPARCSSTSDCTNTH